MRVPTRARILHLEDFGDSARMRCSRSICALTRVPDSSGSLANPSSALSSAARFAEAVWKKPQSRPITRPMWSPSIAVPAGPTSCSASRITRSTRSLRVISWICSFDSNRSTRLTVGALIPSRPAKDTVCAMMRSSRKTSTFGWCPGGSKISRLTPYSWLSPGHHACRRGSPGCRFRRTESRLRRSGAATGGSRAPRRRRT